MLYIGLVVHFKQSPEQRFQRNSHGVIFQDDLDLDIEGEVPGEAQREEDMDISAN